MLGDQSVAEDVVQDACLGLYRRWSGLDDRDKVLAYLRASVVNGRRCPAVPWGSPPATIAYWPQEDQ